MREPPPLVILRSEMEFSRREDLGELYNFTNFQLLTPSLILNS